MPLTIMVKRAPGLIGKVECVGFPFKPYDGIFAYDTECTGLDPWGKRGVDREHCPARPFAFSFCDLAGNWAYVRWPVNPYTREVIRDQRTFDLIQNILGDAKLEAAIHNGIYDWRMSAMSGFDWKVKVFDTLIGMHVINPDEFTYGLKPLSKKYLEIADADEKDLGDSTKKARHLTQRARLLQGKLPAIHTQENRDFARRAIAEDVKADYWLADPELCRKYAVTDAQRCIILRKMEVEAFDADKKEGGKMWPIFLEQMELQKVLYRMENKGVTIDMPRRAEIEKFYTDLQGKYAKEIVKEAGKDFNPRSNQQKVAEFFGKRGFKPIRYIKDKSKKDPSLHPDCGGRGCKLCQMTGKSPQCDGEFLEKIGVKKGVDTHGNDTITPADPLAYWLLHNSAANTMQSFITQYGDLAESTAQGFVIHPNYKQAGPITDRFSCASPNLQNVAADDSGKKRSNVPYRPREVFIPRRGKVLYLPDYSQLQVWICALRSGDKSLLKILLAGGDTHGRIADFLWPNDFHLLKAWASQAKLDAAPYGTKPEAILNADELGNWKTYKKRRKRSKNVQFTKMFGGGPGKLAETAGCTLEEAQRFYEDYDSRFQGITEYTNRCKYHGKQFGYIENAFGRRYPVDPNRAYRASNYDIQGTEAHLVKRAMIRMDKMTRTKHLGKLDMLLTIHDELMLEGDLTNHNKMVMRDMVHVMQADSTLLGCPVPLPVGMKIASERWSQTQEVELN